jgi:hypothetical protein
LQLGNRNLKRAVFGLEVHVPTVEADSALNGLLAEIRVAGMSDKRWNVLCQSAACLAYLAYGRTPKVELDYGYMASRGGFTR